jgi:NAD+ synthase
MENLDQLADGIIRWIHKQVEDAGAEGLVVGLSGGVDSACTTALAKRAVGDAVLAVLMPCHSHPEDLHLATQVANTLGVETLTVDLGPAFDQLLKSLPDAGRMTVSNIKPRLRMVTLYYLASHRNYLVAGTGNRSELMIGYFTKYGDGGVDLEPLGQLYKWQVRQLARHLGIPNTVVDRPPSAGLWPGQTDEGEFGLTYDQLDATLAAIERRDTSEIQPAVLTRVQRMIERSTHKRLMPPVYQVEETR